MVGIAVVVAVIFDFAPADRVRVRTIHAVIAVALARRGAVRIPRIAPVWVIVVIVIPMAELPARGVGLMFPNAMDR